MDPDVTRELEDQLRSLSDMISQQTAAMNGLAQSISSSNTSVNNVTTSSNKLASAQTENQKATNQNTSGAGALQKANKDAADVIAASSANMARAMDNLGSGLNSFTKSVLSSEQGFSKYNTTIGKLGDTAFDVGKNFGILGVVLGGLLKVFGVVLQYQTQQADAMLGATDSFARMGAGGAFTAEQVRKMGAGAGLSSLELDKLVKPMQSVKGGFVALGGSQAEGMKKFGEMAAVSEDVRREFKRLGMGDQERNQALADFVSLMNASGQAMNGDLKSQGGMQKAALDYTRNMYALSAITGDDVETAKKKHQAAMDTMEVALFNNKMQQDMMKAEEKLKNAKTATERASAEAELNELKKKDEAFKNFTLQMEKAGMSQEDIAAAQNQIITGAVTETSAKFTRMGFDVDGLYKKASDGTLQDGEVAQKYNDSVQDTIDRVGYQNLALSKETRDLVGITKENTGRATQFAGKSMEEIAKTATGAIKANQGGQGPAGTDPAQKARNDLTEVTRTAKLKLDDLAAQFNPLLGNMGMLKILAVAAGAAAAALAVVALGGGAKKIGSLFGFGGGGVEKRLAALEKGGAGGIAGAAGQAMGGKALGGAEGKAMTDLKAMSGAGGPGGGSFLEGVVRALIAAGKGFTSVIQGATGLSVAIIEISAALGIGSVILGVTLPALATGLSKFNKIDGQNLKQVGFGMAGLGAGIAAMGAGTVVGAIGNVINWFVGGEDPLENTAKQIAKLQTYDINKEKVENNSQAMVAFSTAMAKSSLAGGAAGLGNIGSAIAESTTRFFKATPPLTQFVAFSLLPINAKQTLNNATAFRYFAEAMAAYQGMGSPIGAISTAIAQAAFKFFGVKPPLAQFVDFSKLNIDQKKTTINAKAFVDFANAMAAYKGGPGLLDTISSLAGKGFGALFGQDGPIEAFEKFAQKDFGPKMTENSEAFAKYAQTVATLSIASGGGGGGSFGGAVQSGVQAGAAVGGALVGAVGGAASAVGDAIGGAAESAWSTVTAGWDALKIKSILNFTGSSGSFANFQALNPEMKKAVLAAGSEYKQETGKKLQVNSAKRSLSDQQRLWDTSVKNGTPGRQPNGRLVAKPNANAPHMKGNAIDLQQGINDTARTNRILAKYKLVNKYGKRDLPHYDLQAENGGIFDGSDAGYPITMHGSEMVAPLDTNSILMKLAKTPVTSSSSGPLSSAMPSGQRSKTAGNVSEQASMNLELYGMISKKVERMIDLLESSHDTHDKMLSHAKV